MKVTINGVSREVPDGLTIATLLEHLGIHPGRVAVEHNRTVISRNNWESTQLQPGDNIEIVHFVGGG
jgi:thiamine biosynthesis protein ThiS